MKNDALGHIISVTTFPVVVLLIGMVIALHWVETNWRRWHGVRGY